MNIQDVLKLLSVYDQSKMQYNVDNCNGAKASDSKDWAESEIEVKEEIESKDFIIDNNNENYNNYENLKLENEEIDLKFENSDGDDTDQSTYRCETVDVGKRISNNEACMNTANKEKKPAVNYPENYLENVKKYNFLKCEIDSITNQIKNQEMCHSGDSLNSNKFTCHSKRHIKNDFKQIVGAKKVKTLKHNVKNNSQIFKCQHCNHETHLKSNLTEHTKSHKKIRDFKCTLCSEIFTWKNNLDYHLLRIHKCRDVAKKHYNCDQCSSEYLTKRQLMRHKIKHGITDGIPILKCYQCNYETYLKYRLNRHVKIHKKIKDFKCTLCSKAFNQKIQLDEHLLKIHKDKGAVNKLYSCNHCSYVAVREGELLLHKLKHGITSDFLMLRCSQCTFQTYRKISLNKHIKIHSNIKDFKCTFCSKEFTTKHTLNDHLLRIHKYSDVTKKLHSCDQCSCEFLTKRDLLKHKIKHGITDGMPSLKCSKCTFETYRQSSLIKHATTHRKVKDFKCTYCSAKFSYKSTLERHSLRFHS